MRDRAADEDRCKAFLEGLALDFAALRADPKAWAEIIEERKLLESTLMDGIATDEYWTADGKAHRRNAKRGKK